MKIILSEEFRRMQKLAGIISEIRFTNPDKVGLTSGDLEYVSFDNGDISIKSDIVFDDLDMFVMKKGAYANINYNDRFALLGTVEYNNNVYACFLNESDFIVRNTVDNNDKNNTVVNYKIGSVADNRFFSISSYSNLWDVLTEIKQNEYIPIIGRIQ
jgi:hypothetical protein